MGTGYTSPGPVNPLGVTAPVHAPKEAQAPVVSVAQLMLEFTRGMPWGYFCKSCWKIGPTVVGRPGQAVPLFGTQRFVFTKLANCPLFTKLKNCCVITVPVTGEDWRRRCASKVP